jgi:hypothetical protein
MSHWKKVLIILFICFIPCFFLPPTSAVYFSIIVLMYFMAYFSKTILEKKRQEKIKNYSKPESEDIPELDIITISPSSKENKGGLIFSLIGSLIILFYFILIIAVFYLLASKSFSNTTEVYIYFLIYSLFIFFGKEFLVVKLKRKLELMSNPWIRAYFYIAPLILIAAYTLYTTQMKNINANFLYSSLYLLSIYLFLFHSLFVLIIFFMEVQKGEEKLIEQEQKEIVGETETKK